VQQQQTYTDPYARPQSNQRVSSSEETGLDQLSRLLQESHPGSSLNGNGQTASVRPGLSVDQQELQELRAQLTQAAREDEAYGRTYSTYQPQARPETNGSSSGVSGQLRASPIQDVPFEREIENRRNGSGAYNASQGQIEGIARPTQGLPPASAPIQPITPLQEAPAQFSPNQSVHMDIWARQTNAQAPHASSPGREAQPSIGGSGTLAANEGSGTSTPNNPVSGPLPLSLTGDEALAEQVRANLQQTLAQRPQVRTSDDTLLDIVKSLPPMEPAPQPPQVQVLNGRATRSLGSVLLEGHLVPQERLQVAQHVQRMLRGVDLNYQLGEILLMFKLLTPDQLLAASLVSYGMISTVQITALGRVRQELHAIGLEYDLESLLVLFRMLTPEQLREVRSSWSS
jgi:hypothetical protein